MILLYSQNVLFVSLIKYKTVFFSCLTGEWLNCSEILTFLLSCDFCSLKVNVRLKPVETCCWAARSWPKCGLRFVLGLFCYVLKVPEAKIGKCHCLCYSFSPFTSGMNTQTHIVPVRVWKVFGKASGSICHLQHLLKTGSDNTGLLVITITRFTWDAVCVRGVVGIKNTKRKLILIQTLLPPPISHQSVKTQWARMWKCIAPVSILKAHLIGPWAPLAHPSIPPSPC